MSVKNIKKRVLLFNNISILSVPIFLIGLMVLSPQQALLDAVLEVCFEFYFGAE